MNYIIYSFTAAIAALLLAVAAAAQPETWCSEYGECVTVPGGWEIRAVPEGAALNLREIRGIPTRRPTERDPDPAPQPSEPDCIDPDEPTLVVGPGVPLCDE